MPANARSDCWLKNRFWVLVFGAADGAVDAALEAVPHLFSFLSLFVAWSTCLLLIRIVLVLGEKS